MTRHGIEPRHLQRIELRPHQRLGVVAIENGAFESLSTMVANLTYFYIDYDFQKIVT